MYIFACAFDSQRLRSVFPSIILHITITFYFEYVYMLCLCACLYVNTCVHGWISEVNLGCWSSSSTVIRTRTLVVHGCEWQESWPLSIQKFSCVYFSSCCMHAGITNVNIPHSFWWALGIWNSGSHACPSRNVLCEPSSHPQPRQGFQLSLQLTDLARLAGHQVADMPHLCLPGPEISRMVFYWVLGIQTQTLMLSSKHL